MATYRRQTTRVRSAIAPIDLILIVITVIMVVVTVIVVSSTSNFFTGVVSNTSSGVGDVKPSATPDTKLNIEFTLGSDIVGYLSMNDTDDLVTEKLDGGAVKYTMSQENYDRILFETHSAVMNIIGDIKDGNNDFFTDGVASADLTQVVLICDRTDYVADKSAKMVANLGYAALLYRTVESKDRDTKVIISIQDENNSRIIDRIEFPGGTHLSIEDDTSDDSKSE